MESISSISKYLEKYSIFYLFKYSVTKKKFKKILERKITKDIKAKKILTNQIDECNKQIALLIDKFVNIKIIDEERQIKFRIDYLISKGSSLKKIFYILSKDLYEKHLIESELNDLKNIVDFESQLIETYCRKKKLAMFDKKFDKKNTIQVNKIIKKLLVEGFSIDNSKKFIYKS